MGWSDGSGTENSIDPDIRKDGENFLREQMKKYFPNNEIMYVV